MMSPLAGSTQTQNVSCEYAAVPTPFTVSRLLPFSSVVAAPVAGFTRTRL
jgi:hypothetical protein